MNLSHRSSGVARTARLSRPNTPDIYGMLELQPLRPFCHLHAARFALPYDGVALTALVGNDATVDTLVLTVMAAEASDGMEVAVVGEVCIPPDFHRWEIVIAISVLQVSDGSPERFLPAFVDLRVMLLVVSTH